MIVILQQLIHKTYVDIHGEAPTKDSALKPCDHFDLICGTGTGGLIAIMLGRLRLDLETCAHVYAQMTQKVFETDKMIGGIPYRSTLFKASKLEEAIMECVAEHTTKLDEGNDGEEPIRTPISAMNGRTPQRHLSNASVLSFSSRRSSAYINRSSIPASGGNPNALLYDHRENRTKT